MSKITNEQIFELLTGLQENQTGMQESIGGMQESIGGMQESIGGMQESIGGMQESIAGILEKQEELALSVFDIKENLKNIEDNYIEIAKDVKYTKDLVEKDAKKQQIHEEEHVSNIAAHDRFETRIKALEVRK